MSKIGRTKNATRNIIYGVLLKVYRIIVPFVMRTVMIYFLGVDYVGLNSLFTSILQVLNLAELGVGAAMVFSMYKPIAESDDITLCALMKLYKTYYNIIGIVVASIGIALTPFIPNLIDGEVPADINIYILYFLNLGATVLSYWLFAYKSAILQAHQRSDVLSKVTLITNTIQYAIQLLVLLWFRNYYYYVIVALLTQALTNIVTATVADKLYPRFVAKGYLPKEDVKKINQKIRDLFTAKLGTVIVGSADTIVISAFLGLTTLAVYQNYYFIMNAIFGVFLVIFSSVTAGIGNSLVTENTQKNYSDMKKFTFLTCWLITMCVCSFAVLYQPFMKMWVGEELMLDYSYVIMFCIYFYVLVLSMVWASIKDAAGLWHQDRFRPLIGALANLVMNLIMVQYIGLYGIILSTVLSYVLITMPWIIFNIFKYLYKVPKREYITKLFLYVLVCAICTVLTIVLCNIVRVEGIIAVILYGAIAVLVSCLLQYVFYCRMSEFKESKQLLLKMLRKG